MASRFDSDASWGNARVARAAFIRERMAQTGCLAIEAAREWARLNPAQAAPVGDGRVTGELRRVHAGSTYWLRHLSTGWAVTADGAVIFGPHPDRAEALRQLDAVTR